ncbi:MAG: hypothetical protein JSV46_07600 [Candidatus Aminicenantes bacterium]|nr:MAG: hypothetical protein JSV46_07600 [Candidatus Aminicenantes bacterium]
MKKLAFFIPLIVLCLYTFSQEVFVKESLVINIEVPVRVFKSNIFVEDLTIDDFEVLEDGVPQKIEAVYLVKKRTVVRSEEKKRLSPQTSRNFYLFFEIAEYSPKLREAVSYFLNNVLFPGDNLVIVTPMKTYRMKARALEVTSREAIEDRIVKLLRTDIMLGNSEYRNLIADLSGLAKALSTKIQTGTVEPPSKDNPVQRELDITEEIETTEMPLDEQLIYYEALLGKLETIRKIDHIKLLEFSKFLKEKDGQKYIFMFYQREFIPQVDPKILTQYMSLYQQRPDILATITNIFDYHRRDVTFDVEPVRKAYSDSSASIHFLFISTPRPDVYGVYMEEYSEDIFTAFKEMADSTGGYAETSMNPAISFKRALNASENYYLLYYSPKEYQVDGKFKEIRVRVLNKNYRVVHRAGYFAN